MIIYLDMDDVLCNFKEAHEKALKENPCIEFPQSQYGFFSGLQPKEGAVDAVNKLIKSDVYDPYILTAPSLRNPLCYTEKRVWVEQWLGYDFVEKLIICPNKGLLNGEILVDDNIAGKGQEGFGGRLIHFGSEQYPNWASIVTELGI